MLLKTVILSTLIHMIFSIPIPPNDKALFDQQRADYEIEERRKHKNRRPCRGRSEEGRTFFDLSFQYLDVNYNQNYNINCGGGGGGGGGHKPLGGGHGGNKPLAGGGGGGHFSSHGGNKPGGGLFGGNRPLLGGGNQGSGLLGGLFSQSQSQIQGIGNTFNNVVSSFFPPQGGSGLLGSLIPQDGLGSLIPQGGLFNGQGISSLFENGLFSNIFGNTGPSSGPPAQVPPSIPQQEVVNNRPLPVTPVTPDPDMIYNDEKPVHEDHDDVLPDTFNYNNLRPGPWS